MKNAVLYKGVYLMPNSHAHALYFDKDDANHKKLDKHMKELAAKEKELQQRYGGL